jgi:hypothetical protein
MRVILQAKEIPEGSIVTLPGMDQQYVLLDEVEVFSGETTYENMVQPDCLFMIVPGDLGSLKAVPRKTMLEWIVLTKEDYIKLRNIIVKHC